MKALFVLAAALLGANVAQAADMAVKAPPRLAPAPVVDSWQGFYFGVNGGQNLGSFSPIFGTGTTATEVNLDDNSWFVGGHAGYLLQSGAVVFGPEIGVQFWDFKSRGQLAPAVGATPAVLLQERLDFVAYANMRVGFALSSVYVYATGGAAWAHVKGELINLAAIDTANEQSLLGWNIGAGAEFKLTPSLILGAEYRHYDFGKVQSVNPTVALALGIKGDALTTDQVMGRLSYRPSIDRY